MSDILTQTYATVVEVLIPGPQGPVGESSNEIGGHEVSIEDIENGHIIVFNGTVWHNQPLESGGDMMRAVYDTENNGKVDVARLAETVPWTGIFSVPTSFPPDAHGHVLADVTGLQTALDEKAALASPAFSGVPSAPTATTGTNTTQLATTAFVASAVAAVTPGEVTWADVSGKPSSFTPSAHTHAIADVTGLQTVLGEKAELASPAFSGAPTAPTATTGTNTTQLATTAFVASAVAAVTPGEVTWADVSGKPSNFTPSAHTHAIADVTELTTALADKAPLASPAFTNTPTAPTAAVGTDTTQIATTAFVNASIVSTPTARSRDKLINGRFWLWQRGTTQNVNGYKSVDRWYLNTAGSGVTSTLSRVQAGGIGWPNQLMQDTYYARMAFATGTGPDRYVRLEQRIEGVGTLSGQKATLTLWARATTSGLFMAANIWQNFGSGGSSAVQVNGQKAVLTTSWQKISFVFDIPITAGKTPGANNYLNAVIWFSGGGLETVTTDNLPAQSGTVDIAHVSLVSGDARGEYDALNPRHYQQEMALCERYYESNSANVSWTQPGNSGAVIQYFTWPFSVPKRANPTVVFTQTLGNCALSTVNTRYMLVTGTGATEQANAFTFTADAEL